MQVSNCKFTDLSVLPRTVAQEEGVVVDLVKAGRRPNMLTSYPYGEGRKSSSPCCSAEEGVVELVVELVRAGRSPFF